MNQSEFLDFLAYQIKVLNAIVAVSVILLISTLILYLLLLRKLYK